MNKYDYFIKMPRREDEISRKTYIYAFLVLLLFLILLGIATQQEINLIRLGVI